MSNKLQKKILLDLVNYINNIVNNIYLKININMYLNGFFFLLNNYIISLMQNSNQNNSIPFYFDPTQINNQNYCPISGSQPYNLLNYPNYPNCHFYPCNYFN